MKKGVVETCVHTKHQHIPLGGSLDVGPFTITKLGQTLDDAAGEVFDKVARMLWGPYPGGKRISDLAASGKENPSISLHAAKLPDQPLNFSLSGIKSQVHTLVESGKVKVENGQGTTDKWQWTIEDQTVKLENEQMKADIARRFQEEVTENLVEKLAIAAELHEPKTIGLVGGVSANTRLREQMASHPDLYDKMLRTPKKFIYCTDNAAMIGVVGLIMKNE